MATKNKKSKLDSKKVARNIMVALVIAVIGYGLYNLYQLGYKRGYLAGSENQVICQASQSNDNLKPLCK